MRIQQQFFALVVACACVLVGCGNDLEGKWTAKDQGCGRDEITVKDMKGSGTIHGADENGQCITCSFDLTATDRGSNSYTLDIEFDQCSCNGDRSAKSDCEMNGNEDRLSCSLDWGPCSPAGTTTLAKQD